MGLDILVETEAGEEVSDTVSDPHNLLPPLLPDHRDTSFACLRFIDRYGNTIFNCLQVDDVINELKRLKAKAHLPSQLELLDSIIALAHKVKESPHRYLKFYGD